MNSLRDKIGTAVHDARHGMAIDDATDRILALIAEAMLSGKSLVAAVDAGYQISPNLPSHYRATTQAQLTAAGITGAGQEGGEGE